MALVATNPRQRRGEERFAWQMPSLAAVAKGRRVIGQTYSNESLTSETPIRGAREGSAQTEPRVMAAILGAKLVHRPVETQRCLRHRVLQGIGSPMIPVCKLSCPIDRATSFR